MLQISQHRTKAKVVAILNLVVLSIGSLIALGVWLFLTLRSVQDFSDYFSSQDGKELIGFSGLIIVGAGLEGVLAVTLLFALKENSFTRLKIWFLVQTVYLAAITMGFLVDLTSPRVPTLVPIFLVIVIKSVSLWVVSKYVDDMKAARQQARLIPPFAPSDGSYRHDQCYSPTASNNYQS
ncbi:unnamed protein product [Allacma fusca]|uniref:Uncharacterized protein n=1 Tax=Allacma fusca TaxID=39272 RepID=A0A8J2NJ70_9HEXA|nr:unnamed protein product [Allacma fusca]